MTKRPWIGTSWKMNKTIAEADAFCETVARSPWASDDRAQLFVIPPFTVLHRVAQALDKTDIIVGAQNVHWKDAGAWTGEVSPVQVKDCGGRLVEIGHSERREHFGETDETVSLKTEAAVRHGLVALVCIGDTREEYDAGRTAEALRRQTEALISRVEWSQPAKVIIAYEPVWSIGEGGTPAEPSFANEQHARIKELTREKLGFALPVLYGGSVNPGNCVELANQEHIDGLFIGRSAWNAEGYLSIVSDVASSLS
ncbi:triose-phosphate isomerase [Aureimonas phyllosphaerae]|uniref:Triosephosphate isomerase n=1 Tax=Aureimonas phyllosphaerae TaxID=1166078 RepID=A0A7W6BZ87_9HYPH|nr:triose-phosphate isomerase [Aureimonas phyllosphaerae]MBB3935517.1 triosephosphate isomerase [Aureimonas phyllosphaerae]MBB3959525.1 triosephosphate isomerase [Aureimonas phyllosphaerae]SFF11670.1 triosephosphate isomerase [Aureimonas phyllosphaerae]